MFRFDYLNSGEAAICILEDTDSDLYVRHIDEKWLEILQLGDTSIIGHPVSSILSNADYLIIHNACDKLRHGRKTYHFIHYFNTNRNRVPVSISLISLDTDTNYIICYALKMNIPMLSYDNQLSKELNQIIYNTSFDSVFTLQLTYSDHLILLNYNATFSEFFNMNNKHFEFQDLAFLLPPDVVNCFIRNVKTVISTQTTLNKSYEYHYTEQEQKQYLCPSDHSLYGLLTFLPLSQPEYRTVLVCVKDICDEVTTKRSNMELIEEYQWIFNTSNTPITIFRFSKEGTPYLERRNPAMLSILQVLQPLTLEQLFAHPLWKQMLATKKACETTHTIIRNQRKYHYKLMLLPIIRDDQIYKAVFTMVDSTALVNEQLSPKNLLTKRELEIISYVLKGEKNSFIAKTLGISDGTVKRTLSNAYSKLGISSRVELLNYYHTNLFD